MTNYNLTNLTNASDIGGLIRFANEASGSVFLGFILIAVFFVILASLKRFEFPSALLAASWLSFLLGLMLAYGGLVSPLLPLGFLLLGALTALYIWTTEP